MVWWFVLSVKGLQEAGKTHNRLNGEPKKDGHVRFGGQERG